MDSIATLLTRLSGLLTEYGIGLSRLTPRPQGGRLSGAHQEEVGQVINSLEAQGPPELSLVYGNGCFALGRYDAAVAVYHQILDNEPDQHEARFNLGLAYLRLKKLREATKEFIAVDQGRPFLG